MPALAWGGLCIPCLMRVPASETTATELGGRLLCSEESCHRCQPSAWGWIRSWEAGREPLSGGRGSLLLSLKRSSLSSYVNIPKLSQRGHFLLNSSGKVATVQP